MDEHLHNDNLEDFFRKSLKDFEDNPDDTAWGNIAPFITIQSAANTVDTNTSYLQNQVVKLSRQNKLLKALLGVAALLFICFFTLYVPQKQQTELSQLQEQFSQQKQTIHELQNQVGLLTQENSNKERISEVAERQSAYLPDGGKANSSTTFDFNEESNESSNRDGKAGNVLDIAAKAPFRTPTNRHSQTSMQFNKSADLLVKSNITDYQKPIREEKTPFFTKNNLGDSLEPPSFKNIDNQYIVHPIASIPFSFVEANSPSLTEFEPIKNHRLKPKLSDEKSEKRKKNQLPSLNLKPILDRLTIEPYLQVGKVENQFRYEDSFLEEGFFDFNGSFIEDANLLQYGLSVEYAINPQLSIQSGMGQLELQQHIDDISLMGIYTAPNQKDELELEEQFYTSYSNNELEYTLSNVSQHFPNVEVGDTLRIPIETEQVIKYVNIPLAAKYTLFNKNRRLRLYLKAGVNFNLFRKNELKIASSHASFADYEDTHSTNLEETYWSYQLEAGLQYRIARNLNISVAPYYTGSLSQMTEDMPVLAYPSTNGIRFGASYDF